MGYNLYRRGLKTLLQAPGSRLFDGAFPRPDFFTLNLSNLWESRCWQRCCFAVTKTTALHKTQQET